MYDELSKIGQVFGPAFQGVAALRVHGTEALGQIVERVEPDSPHYLLFPPSFDSCFHPSAALEKQARGDSRAVVTGLQRLRLFRRPARAIWSHLRIAHRSATSYLADLSILDSAGAVLAEVDGLAVRTIDSARSAQRKREVYQMQWEKRGRRRAPIRRRGDVFCDDEGRGEALAAALRADDTAVTLIHADADRKQRNGSTLNVNLREENWAERLQEALAAAEVPPRRFVYFWSGFGSELRRSLRDLARAAASASRRGREQRGGALAGRTRRCARRSRR